MFRIGIGHDTHRLIESSSEQNALVLGGVRVEHNKSLLGHSDADVLLHAVTDALLGAAGLGDIGEMFPDTDLANRDRDSATMLRLAWRRVQQSGWQIVNIDTIVFAQKPKIAPFKELIQKRIAEILDVEADQVGVKAKTGEHVGPVGREEAISAECVALLKKRD